MKSLNEFEIEKLVMDYSDRLREDGANMGRGPTLTPGNLIKTIMQVFEALEDKEEVELKQRADKLKVFEKEE
jgi:hypothetical protein